MRSFRLGVVILGVAACGDDGGNNSRADAAAIDMAVVIDAAPDAGPPPPSGSLDMTFGTNGRVRTVIPATKTYFGDVVVMPNGKIVATGEHGNDMMTARYGADGGLDSTFSGDGLAFGDSGNKEYANSVVVLPTGEVYVGGVSINTTSNFMSAELRAYDPNGVPLTTFSGDGVMSFISGSYTNLLKLMLTANNELLCLTATAPTNSDIDTQLARVTLAGALDGTFGTGGKVDHNLAPNDIPSRAALAGNNVVIIGTTGTPTGPFVARMVAATGALDTTFDTDGFNTYDPRSGSESGREVIPLSDGTILIAFSGSDTGTEYGGIMKLTSAGALDATFGTGGIAYIAGLGAYASLSAMTLQADGKILVASRVIVGSARHAGISRFNVNGLVDATFGTNGNVVYPMSDTPDDYDGPYAITVQPDGKIVIAGSGKDAGNADQTATLLRVWP